MIPNCLISVIIPVYNVEPWLDACLESVVGQTYQNLEIIIVNDGSTDSSGALCEKWAKKDSRIKHFVQENAGLSAARNTALRNATGDYYLFVDSDDYIEPNMTECLYKALTEQNADMAVCGFFVQFANSAYKRRSEQHSVVNSEVLLKRILDKSGSATCAVWNKLYPAKLFEGVSFIEGRTFEDVAILPSLIKQCRRIIEILDCLYHYRVRENSITDTMTLKNLEDRWHSHDELRAFIDQQYPQLRESACLYQLRYDVVLWSNMNLVAEEYMRRQQNMSTLRNRINANKKYIPNLKPRLHVAAYLILYGPHIYGFLYRVYYRIRRYRREKNNGTAK